MSRTRTISVSVILPALVLVVAGPALAGDIVGKVRYAGTAPTPAKIQVTKDQAVCGKATHVDESLIVGADKGMMYVVVKVADPKDGKKMTPAKKPALDQNGCKFVPHVEIVPAGAEIDIVNSDGILHNIHSFPKNNPPFNKAQPKFKKVMPATFAKPDIVQVKCDVHSWMNGWVVVAEHPYYAITDASGAYTISGVPAGTYTLESWQEKLGKQTKPVTVPATGSVTVDLEYAAK
ncbi:MAG TPA: carboxypeptidase regulatory-like domain-containing protein [Candidatus Binatia bacterium]|nr:carboxypeptidase regulatory-like domain-containing protein [Candidatus Binatia bacterium]